MTGAVIGIDDASANDTIRSVKERVFAANRKLYVRRQRLMYRPGPHGMEPLADDETLGGAGVAQDGSAELDVLLMELKPEEVAAINGKVWQKYIRFLGHEFIQVVLCYLITYALIRGTRMLAPVRPIFSFRQPLRVVAQAICSK